MSNDNQSNSNKLKWYQGISKYQWLVLTIASLGWIFDVFEGQIFVASMNEAMPSLLGVDSDHASVKSWNDWALGSFLLGGAVGGVLFGMLADRIGRSRTMVITILFYSLFTCVTAFAQAPWQMVVLRFFVAMGVGGEWAVASAMVAEVMPLRSRPIMSSIFHASSVFGTFLAAATGAFVVGNESLGPAAWRWGFAIGAFPALLTVWIRWKLREPEKWTKSKEAASQEDQRPGRIFDLFNKENARNTLVGVMLSSVGLVTFWGIHIYGKNALQRHAQAEALIEEAVSPDADKKVKQEVFAKHRSKIKNAEMLSMVLNSFGGGLGLVLFGVISTYLGRKGAFIFYHLFAFIMVIVLFKLLVAGGADFMILAIAIPFFGFFTVGLHAGYAVYFPELYPTRLRGTGSGFCFNMGRLATAAAFFAFGTMSLNDEQKALWLSPLFLVGIVIVLFAKETNQQELLD